VEDDPLLRRVLVLLLESLGHQVDARASCAAALADLGRSAFDVALVDMTLPDGRGIDVAAALRALPAEERPHVVGMSGFDPSPEELAAVDSFLPKPTGEDELLGLFRRIAAARAG
jgi:CheY-like chemotaxis protein